MISDKLDQLINNEARTDYTNYNLNGIIKLLELFGNPHHAFRSIHIAGTNGKGSVAYSLAGIFQKSGYKTGLFTSPHLLNVNERIKINGADIPDNDMDKYIDETFEILDSNPEIKPTYFDVLTTICFKYFYDSKIDIAVIETGLGGKLDSTNVLIPECSIITDISLDHTSLLGNTAQKITSEKCGIIKPGKPVITSNSRPEILNIISETCSKTGSRLYSYENEFTTTTDNSNSNIQIFNYKFNDNNINDIRVNTPAVFQIKNVSLSITAAMLLSSQFTAISEKSIIESLHEFNVPGRLQVLHDNPLIIFDPAHNPAALNNVLDVLKKQYNNFKIFTVL